jgi:hypothetical protein
VISWIRREVIRKGKREINKQQRQTERLRGWGGGRRIWFVAMISCYYVFKRYLLLADNIYVIGTFLLITPAPIPFFKINFFNFE